MADVDVEAARFENGFQIRTEECQRGNRQLPGQFAALPGAEGNPVHTFEFQDRARNAGDRIPDEQEQCRSASDGSRIGTTLRR